MGMTLYEMTTEARMLLDLLEAEEIDEQTVADSMAGLDWESKLESYCQIQKTLEAEYAAHKAEIERHEKRMDSLAKQIERMKMAELDFMIASGQKKLKAGTFTVSVRETPSCEITDEGSLPERFTVQIPASTRPDKRAILTALKAGEEISGAALRYSRSLQIK